MNRQVQTSKLVFDQVIVYDPQSPYDRIPGVVPGDITLSVFRSGVPQSWTVEDGSTVQDFQISSGSVFWGEISSHPGFYSIRLFIPSTGYWTFSFKHSNGYEYVINYDALPIEFCGGNDVIVSFQ